MKERNRNHTKKTVLAAVAIIMLFTLSGCGSAVPERLVGEWQCDDTASGNHVDTGFYALRIESDGNFSLYDAEAGNPGISGTMKGDDTGKIGILELSCDKGDFDPPACWPNLHTNSRIRYKILDENSFKLGYVGIWMTFRK